MIDVCVNLSASQFSKMGSSESSLGLGVESSVNEGLMCLFDTGSSYTLSGDSQDFQEVDSEPTISITGIDGKVNGGFPIGFLGTLWPNNLGIRRAIFLPSMGSTDRIISLDALTSNNWEVYLAQSLKYLKKRDTVQKIHRGRDNCPYVWEIRPSILFE